MRRILQRKKSKPDLPSPSPESKTMPLNPDDKLPMDPLQGHPPNPHYYRPYSPSPPPETSGAVKSSKDIRIRLGKEGIDIWLPPKKKGKEGTELHIENDSGETLRVRLFR
jgi:hypothetical protein